MTKDMAGWVTLGLMILGMLLAFYGRFISLENRVQYLHGEEWSVPK